MDKRIEKLISKSTKLVDGKREVDIEQLIALISRECTDALMDSADNRHLSDITFTKGYMCGINDAIVIVRNLLG
jgi:hypothetical protein